MFEKEAEEYANTKAKKLNVSRDSTIIPYMQTAWRKGAEFGYKKGFEECAKARLNVTTISDCPIKDEWHYVKDGDFPKDEDDVLCQIAKDEFVVGYYHKKNEVFYAISGEFINVIAWKEIVLPELPKESE